MFIFVYFTIDNCIKNYIVIIYKIKSENKLIENKKTNPIGSNFI